LGIAGRIPGHVAAGAAAGADVVERARGRAIDGGVDEVVDVRDAGAAAVAGAGIAGAGVDLHRRGRGGRGRGEGDAIDHRRRRVVADGAVGLRARAQAHVVPGPHVQRVAALRITSVEVDGTRALT